MPIYASNVLQHYRHARHFKIANFNVRILLSLKDVFNFSRILAKRGVFHCFVNSDRTNNMATIKYATFRYDTAEVENLPSETRKMST